MASSEELRREFLTCTICYETYNKPKTLQCLHTFCQGCLSSYIIAEEDTFGVKRKKAFPCPICRALARPPEPTKPLKQWAQDFKTNFNIENLMTALKVKVKSIEQTTLQSVATPRNTREQDESANLDRRSIDPGRDSRTTAARENVSENTSAYNSRLPRRINSSNSRSAEDLTSVSEDLTDNETSVLHSSMPDLNINSRDNVLVTTLSPPLTSKSFELEKSLSAKMAGDRREPRIGGICVVAETIVVIDPENFRVKSFFDWNVRLASNVVTRSLNLVHRPRSVTEIPGFAVAVAVPSNRSIHMIKVTPFLEQFSVVQTTRRYKTIANSGSGSLVAIASRSGSTVPRLSPIDILNFEGDTLRSVDVSYELKRIDFSHIAVSSSGLVHLVDSTGLYCVTQDGVELYRYIQNREQEQFKYLRGLCCRSNDIYLTDKEGHSVYEVVCDCSLPASREKLLSSRHGIKQPIDVHVGLDGNIYVACREGTIRVYRPVKQRGPVRARVETVV